LLVSHHFCQADQNPGEQIEYNLERRKKKSSRSKREEKKKEKKKKERKEKFPLYCYFIPDS
jgi:hypothetical protein